MSFLSFLLSGVVLILENDLGSCDLIVEIRVLVGGCFLRETKRVEMVKMAPVSTWGSHVWPRNVADFQEAREGILNYCWILCCVLVSIILFTV